MSVENRRPIKTRNNRIIQVIARRLVQWKIQPNTISICSVIFAALAALSLGFSFRFSQPVMVSVALIFAAVMIQGRLLCNLFDGMVAVEGGMKTPGGEVYNEVPDRIADSVIFIGLAYGLSEYWGAVSLGYLAALFAMATAYIRVLGGSCGLPQKFLGPFAKQQRMALVTIGTVAAAFMPIQWAQYLLYIILWVLVVGSLWTTVVRTKMVLIDLAQRS